MWNLKQLISQECIRVVARGLGMGEMRGWWTKDNKFPLELTILYSIPWTLLRVNLNVLITHTHTHKIVIV